MTSKLIYHPTNYRSNYITYWRQWYPQFVIPKGYVIHHKYPKSLCKQDGWSTEDTHHPKNLVMLWHEDHQTIHQHRGDTYASCGVMLVSDLDRKHIAEKISESHMRITADGRTAAQVWNVKSLDTKRNTIDAETGLSVMSLAQTKAIKTRRDTIDPDTGQSTLTISAVKGVNTKRNTIDAETGLNMLISIGKRSAESRSHKQKEINKNISKAHIGKEKSEEHRKNIGLAQKGANNNHYTGNYVTPWGVFESTYQAADECPDDIVYQTIRTWCKNNHKTVKKISVTMSNYLTENDIGKTYEELGFSFEPA